MKTHKLISYYPNGVMLKKGADNPPEKYITLKELVALHFSEEMRVKKEKVNQYPYGSDKYKRGKKMLPCVLLNKFRFNLNTGFIKENPIKPFDVDLSDNTPKRINAFREEIKKEAICVLNSTGGGVKFFLKSVFNTADPQEYLEKYKDMCDELEKKYDIVLDRAQGRIKQPFFISYQEK